MLRARFIMTLAAFVFAPALAGGQPIIYVDDDAAPGGDGTSWNTAFRHLRDALAAAAAGDEIHVAQGTYTPDVDEGGHVTRNRTATFQLLNGVALRGGYAGLGAPDPDARDVDAYRSILSGDLGGDDAPAACTQDSPDCDAFGLLCGDDGFCIIADNNDENSYHVVTGSYTDESAVLHGFAITAGNASGAFLNNDAGGGMLNIGGGSPTVTDCTISGNSAGQGGAMYNAGSNPTVTDCMFSGNFGNGRGGGMLNSFSSPMVTNCTFSENLSSGMHNYRSSPTVTNCTFSGNSDGGCGGGMYNNDSNPTVTDCTFSANSATSGGGMCNVITSRPTVINSTFSWNSATEGGGMFNNNSNPTVTNSTFIGNAATNDGGGMSNIVTSRPTVTNSTFGWNSATHGAGMSNNNSNPTVTNSTFSGNIATNDGGGIYNKNNSSPAVSNCILWADVPNEIVTSSGMPVVNSSIIQAGWSGAGGEGIIGADPLFVDALGPDGVPGTADDDLHVLTRSPAVDTGNNAVVPPDALDLDGDGDTIEPTPFDLDGNPRFVEDHNSPNCPNESYCGQPPIVDMGAYEFQGVDCNLDAVGTVDLWDYQILVECAAEGGADEPVPNGCSPADLDFSGRVDFLDFGAFQTCFSSAGR